MKKYIFMLVMAMFVTGCSSNEYEEITINSIVEGIYPNSEYLDDINLDSAIVCTGDEDIYISNSGTYYFSGQYVDREIIVNVDKGIDSGTVYLVLNDAIFNSSLMYPIYIEEAKKVVVLLENDSVNTINQDGVVENGTDTGAAIYSRADLIITGYGELVIETTHADGINSRDDLIIEDTVITINAFDDGLVGKDLVYIKGSTVDLTVDGDGIKSTNTETLLGEIVIDSGTITIDSFKDAMDATNRLIINGGTFDLTTGDGFVEVLNDITVGEGANGAILATSLLEYSHKALKGNEILITGGEFLISSYEDAIHANDTLIIENGTFVIYSGDDALHGDSKLLISGGDITVYEAYEGIEADIIVIEGGDIYINAYDDAVNGGNNDGYVLITGGNMYLTSMGDGLDSNNTLEITGGYIIIDNNAIYTAGDSAVDATNGVTFTGGTIVDADGNAIDPTSSTNTMIPPGGFRR